MLDDDIAIRIYMIASHHISHLLFTFRITTKSIGCTLPIINSTATWHVIFARVYGCSGFQ